MVEFEYVFNEFGCDSHITIYKEDEYLLYLELGRLDVQLSKILGVCGTVLSVRSCFIDVSLSIRDRMIDNETGNWTTA